jgi:hypothetical protein
VGNFPGAMATVERIGDDVQKGVALAAIAKGRAEVGDISGATATAASIAPAAQKAMAYSEIATTQAEAGDIDGAKRTAREIITEDEKEKAHEAIAKAEARARDNEAGLSTPSAGAQPRPGDSGGTEMTNQQIAKDQAVAAKEHWGTEKWDATGSH